MTAEERRRIQSLVQELWRLEGPSVGTHVGDLAWGSTHRTGAEPWRVRIREGGAAWMRGPDSLEYELLPEHRGGPLEEEILDWFERHAGGEAPTACALSTDARRLGFLRARGYGVAAKELDFHLRSLQQSVAIPEVPPGFRLRTLEPGDVERRVAVHRAVWSRPERPSRVTVESYGEVMAAWPYRADLDCVVEAPDGSFAASCLVWLDDANGVGELEPVGTAPAYRRRGLASAVCRFALQRLHEEGATSAIVYSNTPEAKALYESLGFREHAQLLALVKRRQPAS
jgi:ribosomal protein S18 acetylase RimI-like enzyme